MEPSPSDLAQVRLDNALALFEEFVRTTARHADAAALRGLERRFAERLQIQPSYWSQIKGRSRQIGERLARQFEQLCHKPRGWMDTPHTGTVVDSASSAATALAAGSPRSPAGPAADAGDELSPRDDDERFIVGLVLTYYRRHPQRARTRLLDLLGEVLLPAPEQAAAASMVAALGTTPAAPSSARPGMRMPPAPPARPTAGAVASRPPAAAESAHDLWLRTQRSVAPLKSRK